MSAPIDPSIGPVRALDLFREELAGVRTSADLHALRTRWVGRKGSWVAAFMERVGKASPDEKRELTASEELKTTPNNCSASVKPRSPRRPTGAVDITLPGRAPVLGVGIRSAWFASRCRRSSPARYQVLGARDRGRLSQLRSAQHAGRPPGADMQDTRNRGFWRHRLIRSTAHHARKATARAVAAHAPAHAHLAMQIRMEQFIRPCRWSRSVRSIVATTSI
jgi:hypothetical protein